MRPGRGTKNMTPLPKSKTHKTESIKYLKGKCWHLFSRYIRLRDCLETTGTLTYGRCFTCDAVVLLQKAQAGHFVAGRHNGNLFSERGVHLQCYSCNCPNHGLPLEYRRRIIKLYGEGADLELEREASIVRKFTVPELLTLKESLTAKIKEMES